MLICSLFLLHLVALSLTSPTDIQRQAKEMLGRTFSVEEKEKCNATAMENMVKTGTKSNIDRFTPRSVLIEIKKRNCKILFGNLKVNSFGATDRGDSENVRPEDLENLNQLEFIYDGDVELELSRYPDVKQLSFFASLETIYGAFSSFSLRNSSLTSLFPPAYRIITKSMELIDNKDLCYLENFKSFGNLTRRGNKNLTECQQAGAVCHLACHGCFGPGKDNCIECSPGYWKNGGNFPGPVKCEDCDRECTTCSAPGRATSSCSCKRKTYNKTCVSQCPNGTMDYGDNCMNCAEFGNLSPVYNVTESGVKTCKFCDKSCSESCSNSTSKDCFKCKDFKYYYDISTKERFQCVNICPMSTNGFHEDSNGEWICGNKGSHTIAFPSVAVLVIAAISAYTLKLMH